MQIVRRVVLLAAFSLTGVFFAPPCSAASDTQGLPEDPYAKAVYEYVNAAQAEMAAVEQEIAQNLNGPRKEAFASVKRVAERCEALVDRLRNAGPATFDTLKADYERTRAELLKRLKEARNG